MDVIHDAGIYVVRNNFSPDNLSRKQARITAQSGACTCETFSWASYKLSVLPKGIPACTFAM